LKFSNGFIFEGNLLLEGFDVNIKLVMIGVVNGGGIVGSRFFIVVISGVMMI
jgi:hypothetical protein